MKIASPFMRAGQLIRPLTPNEDQRIEELRMDGLSHRAIAKELGREKSTIAYRLKVLSLRDDGL